MLLAAFTLFHVLLSLAGIISGLIVAYAMLAGRIPNKLTDWFLVTTIATSVTGFFFPVEHFLPSHAVGILSLIVLALAGAAKWRQAYRGRWLSAFVISSTVALYFNVFVLVVQMFRRIPILQELAPTQTEPPFQIAQLLVLIAFVAIGVLATKRVRNPGGPNVRTTTAIKGIS